MALHHSSEFTNRYIYIGVRKPEAVDYVVRERTKRYLPLKDSQALIDTESGDHELYPEVFKETGLRA